MHVVTAHHKTEPYHDRTRGEVGQWISAIDLAPVVFGGQREGIYVIFASYGDDSTDKVRSDRPSSQRVLTVGSFFGWPGNFFEAERKWVSRLEKDSIAYFRASECEGLVGEFDPRKRGMSLNSARALADSVRHDLCNIIVRAEGIAGIAISLLLDDFYGLINSNSVARQQYGGDPAILAYKRLIKTSIELIEKDWPEMRIPIAFTFDTFTKWAQAEEAYKQLRETEPVCAERMGYIGHADDKQHPPLQMADLMAHEARHLTLSDLSGSERTRSCTQILIDNHRLYYVGMIGKAELMSTLKLA